MFGIKSSKCINIVYITYILFHSLPNFAIWFPSLNDWIWPQGHHYSTIVEEMFQLENNDIGGKCIASEESEAGGDCLEN